MPLKRKNERNTQIRQYLSQHGCAFDRLPEYEPATPLPLQIYQASPLGTIFRIGSGVTGMTGLCLRVELATKASRGARIEEVEIQCNLVDATFDLLQEPKRAGIQYRFVGGFEMHRNEVLNHRIPGVVYPNHPWVGSLLLWAMGALPPNCKQSFSVGVTIWDNFDRVGSETLGVVLDPTPHREPERDTHTALSPLFAEIEEAPRPDWHELDQFLAQRATGAPVNAQASDSISDAARWKR